MKTLIVTFPVNVKQVSSNSVAIKVIDAGGPTFTQGFNDQVIKQLGVFNGERVLDEIQNDINRRMLLEGVATHAIPSMPDAPDQPEVPDPVVFERRPYDKS